MRCFTNVRHAGKPGSENERKERHQVARARPSPTSRSTWPGLQLLPCRQLVMLLARGVMVSMQVLHLCLHSHGTESLHFFICPFLSVNLFPSYRPESERPTGICVLPSRRQEGVSGLSQLHRRGWSSDFLHCTMEHPEEEAGSDTPQPPTFKS